MNTFNIDEQRSNPNEAKNVKFSSDTFMCIATKVENLKIASPRFTKCNGNYNMEDLKICARYLG